MDRHTHYQTYSFLVAGVDIFHLNKKINRIGDTIQFPWATSNTMTNVIDTNSTTNTTSTTAHTEASTSFSNSHPDPDASPATPSKSDGDDTAETSRTATLETTTLVNARIRPATCLRLHCF